MKKKFKVMGSSREEFMSIEIDMVIDDESIGASCNVLGGSFTITQNGKILVLADKEWVLTLMDITPVVIKEKPKLVINKNLDIFFKTKEIEVQQKCTYLELFNALKKEWLIAGALSNEPFPLEYDEELKLLTFKNSWGFANDSMLNMTDGSFSRLSEDGRSI